MSRTLLEYLTEANPSLDNERSLPGLPTRLHLTSLIEVREWTDFTLPTLMSCYGNLLQARLDSPLPRVSPPLTELERQIFDEDSLDHLLSRSIVPTVSVALRKAWNLCHPEDPNKGIDITRGGRAKISADRRELGADQREGSRSNSGQTEKERAKIFPDWAGVKAISSPRGACGPEYTNRCPGETKLSTKWYSAGNRKEESYMWPIAQVLTYCGENWHTRYGYLITQDELVVLRFSREVIPSGLAMKRSPRGPPPSKSPPQSRSYQSHQRNVSATSTSSRMSIDRLSGHSRESSLSSGVGGMSLGNQSYQDDQLGVEYRPVEMKSIPWKNEGPGRLTVKLALWWIHMMADAPGCDISIGHDYPPLHSWEHANGAFRHVSTGKVSKNQPKSGHILQRQPSQGPSTPPRRGSGAGPALSSPLSSPPSSMDRRPAPWMGGGNGSTSGSSEEGSGNNGRKDRRHKGKDPVR